MSEQQHRPSLSERFQQLPLLARIAVAVVGVTIAVVGVNAVRQAGADSRTADTARSAAPAASQPAAPIATQPAAAPAGQIGPGEWLVGTQVQPGTYRSAGPDEDGGYCMWSRKDSAGAGAGQGIIASDGSYDAAQMLVTIEGTDVVFLTRGCQPFELVS